MTPLALASASASRQKLLRAAGVAFEVCPADIDEDRLTSDVLAKGASASEVAAALAERKAVTVSRRMPGALVLGGDSTLSFQGELLGKCRDLAAQRALLARLAGKDHSLFSAACLARDGVPLWHHVAEARLSMRPFSPEFLDFYLAAEGEVLLSCVGGYRYEGLGAQLFAAVEGDFFTILGLPLLPVLAALRAQGILTP